MRSNSEDTIDIFHLRALTSSSSTVRPITRRSGSSDSGITPEICSCLEVTRRGGRAWGWTDRCDNPYLPVAGAAGAGWCTGPKVCSENAGTAQAQPAVEVARTERIGGGWTTEVIALAKMRLGHALSRYV